MSSNNVWAAWYRCLLDVHDKRQAEKQNIQTDEARADGSGSPESPSNGTEADRTADELDEPLKPVTARCER